MPELHFIVPGPEHAELILGWRRKPWVERTMFSRIDHGVEEQIAWLESCLHRDDYRHWIIVANDRPFGLVNLQKIDWEKRTTSNGYYIGEEDAVSFGAFAVPYVYNHVFFDLGMEEVTADVIADNDIMRLNRLMGSEETVLPGAFERDGERLDVIRLRLTRHIWETKTRFHRYRTDFPWPGPGGG